MPLIVESFVTFAGYNVTSRLKYTFNDTVSVAQTLSTDSQDFCGNKTLSFTINTTANTWLSASNQDYIYFSPPANTTNFGVGQASIYATMDSYSQIVSNPVIFTATTLGCVIPDVTN